MGVSQSCMKELENSKIMNYIIPIDVLRTDKFNNIYDMFMYVTDQLNMSDKDLSDCEKSFKGFTMFSLYSRPKTLYTPEEIRANGVEFRKELNKTVDKHTEYKDGLSINAIMKLEHFNNNYYRHHRRYDCDESFLNTTNIIIIIFVIAGIALYMYRDKIFKR